LVFDIAQGKNIKAIEVGLYPNAILGSPNKNWNAVANSNSDYISVIDAENLTVDTISVKINSEKRVLLAIHPMPYLLSGRCIVSF